MKQPFRVALSISLLVGAMLMLQIQSSGEAVPPRRSLGEFTGAVGKWRAREGAILDSGSLGVLKPTDYLMRRDQDSDGRSVWLFIGYWDSQRRGGRPHSPKDCLPAGGWEPIEASSLSIALPQPFAPITVNRYLVQKQRDQQLVLYWYQAQGKAIAGEMAIKVELLKNSIVRQRADGALVRVSSPVYGSLQETSDRLVSYIQAMYPFLGEFLPD